MATAKVIFNGTTLMDITDTSAVAADVAQDKVFYTKAGVQTTGTAVGGSTASITIEDTLDAAGGTIRTITTEGAQYPYDNIAQSLYPSGNIVLSSTVASIASYAFTGKPITSITALGTTSINTGAFLSCTQLISATFPAVTNIIGSDVFRSCSQLNKIYFPELISISSSYTFMGSNNLTIGVFPKLTSTNQSLRSSPFQTLDFGSKISIGNYWFSGSTNLNTLILRSDEICPITNTGGFSSTPFASGGTGGTIYIPKSLYDHLGDGTAYDYKNATNWSTIDGYGTITWAKIEDSIYQTQYADGTAINNQGGS